MIIELDIVIIFNVVELSFVSRVYGVSASLDNKSTLITSYKI